ncbi:MAG: c-type cytochrome [Chloroflexaceae bacterium]
MHNRALIGAGGVGRVWVGVLLLIVLGACGGGNGGNEGGADTSGGAGGEQGVSNVAAGETLFAQPTLGEGENTRAGCITCHSVDPAAEDMVGVGPNLAGIATRAATQEPGMTAEEYLRASIVDPDSIVIEGFEDVSAIKPQNYGEILSDQEIDALVAYLQSLE